MVLYINYEIIENIQYEYTDYFYTKSVYLENKKKGIKITGVTDEELKNMSIIKIDQPIPLQIMAVEAGIDFKLLSRWNPDYDLFVYHKYATPFYKLRLPKDKVDLFLQKKDNMLKKAKNSF